jgi:flagellar hook assembly protein FlgD
VVELAVETPAGYELGEAYPNPFNPSTTIEYRLPDAGEVELTIYNAAGQSIRRLVQRWQTSGHYAATWDGTDDSGRRVGSGIYSYRLRARHRELTRHLTLIK